MTFRSALGIVGAPSVALAVQSVMYALVTPSCSNQVRFWIHASALAALLLALAFTWLSFQDSRASGAALAEGVDSDSSGMQGSFLAVIGTAVGALSSLVIVAMWAAAWLLSPCSQA